MTVLMSSSLTSSSRHSGSKRLTHMTDVDLEDASNDLDLLSHVAMPAVTPARLPGYPSLQPVIRDFDPEEDYDFDSGDDEKNTVAATVFLDDSDPLSVCRVYKEMCRRARIRPETRFMRQLGHTTINMKGYGLDREGIRAICTCLLNDETTRTVELSGNSIGLAELAYIEELIQNNSCITELHLSENLLQGECLSLLASVMVANTTIKTLGLANNKLKDKDVQTIVDIIETNTVLKKMDLSHNEFGEGCGHLLGKAIAKNETLEELDLSWNHIRAKSAELIALSLVENPSLVIVNLAWNGFGYSGSAALGLALSRNSSLRELDLTCNRIYPRGLYHLTEGLVSNQTLHTLKLALNPIEAVFTSPFLSRLRDSDMSSLSYLDFSGIAVDATFNVVIDQIRESRAFECKYDRALTVHFASWEAKPESSKGLVESFNHGNPYNVDPVRILYFLKQKNTAVDFFAQLDFDGSSSISREELRKGISNANFKLSSGALDELMEYLDSNGDGEIDLLELINGERRYKRKTIAERKLLKQELDDPFKGRSGRGTLFSEMFSSQDAQPNNYPGLPVKPKTPTSGVRLPPLAKSPVPPNRVLLSPSSSLSPRRLSPINRNGDHVLEKEKEDNLPVDFDNLRINTPETH